jgi:hypothetical protein
MKAWREIAKRTLSSNNFTICKNIWQHPCTKLMILWNYVKKKGSKQAPLCCTYIHQNKLTLMLIYPSVHELEQIIASWLSGSDDKQPVQGKQFKDYVPVKSSWLTDVTSETSSRQIEDTQTNMKAATSENKKRGSFGTTASVLIVTEFS